MPQQPNKPSDITQAYQNLSANLTVEHKNRSIHEIQPKNQYFNSARKLYNRKTKNASSTEFSQNKGFKH